MQQYIALCLEALPAHNDGSNANFNLSVLISFGTKQAQVLVVEDRMNFTIS